MHRIYRLNIEVHALRHNTRHNYKKRDRSLEEESVTSGRNISSELRKQIKIITIEIKIGIFFNKLIKR